MQHSIPNYYHYSKQTWSKSIIRPRQDSNLQSSDSKSDALSIRPHGPCVSFASMQHSIPNYYHYSKQTWSKSIIRPRQDSNLQSSDWKSDALSIRPHGPCVSFASMQCSIPNYYHYQKQTWSKRMIRPRQDSNLQSSDSKSDALCIRPHGPRVSFASMQHSIPNYYHY